MGLNKKEAFSWKLILHQYLLFKAFDETYLKYLIKVNEY